MNSNEIKNFLNLSLNLGLGLEGVSTYTKSFDVEIFEDGFIFIPSVPSTFLLNNELYNRIYQLSGSILFPEFTLLKQSGTYLVQTDSKDIHTARGFFYPWYVGVPKRLVIKNLDGFIADNVTEKSIPLMENLHFNYSKIHHIAIAGNSGSGKSQSLIYIMSAIKKISDLVIVDPKFDSPSRFAVTNDIPLVKPLKNRSQDDFVNQVCEVLSNHVELIQTRQEELFNDPKKVFRHKTIVIDELLALSTGVAKSTQTTFFALLSQIALLGRSARVHLILVSQRFDNNALPISVREQCNLILQLGNINKKTTQFLFPDLENSEDIVIPRGPATGVVQIIDNTHASNVLPILMPTIEELI
ncbi:type IV secretion system DNA-binding domain-containing protein [Enterococcus viikkiensis]|uniref:Type IV secretion system DNA-binding domain-containing protein n=1 Tax=Enterococcus viikkiensis TaxID=930854 RepID=A0ABU3FQM9_9ENTE|nr:type IV secretion system DNA-binding domain-containing protein [Enterococcus viikkiensis]MDT2828289.1 type IV secretion system DNA-binding domain-containing protein [Enterococcus viikkiensis]